MTNKEAIGHIMDVICENNTIKPNIVVFEQEKEALYMAIEALKQESILDKIRAEIDKIYEREGSSFDCLNALDELKEFIDKCKAESEG